MDCVATCRLKHHRFSIVLLYQHDLNPLPLSSDTSSQCLKAVAKALDIPAQNSSVATGHWSVIILTFSNESSKGIHTCYPRPEAHFEDPVNIS